MRTASTSRATPVRFADAQEAGQGHRVRRPPGGRLQAHDGNVGACRRAARRGAGRRLACAARRHRRRRRTASSIGLLAWLNAAGCHKLIGGEAPLGELARHPAVRAHVAQVIARWNAGHPASSERIARVLLLPDVPRSTATRSPTRATSTSGWRSSGGGRCRAALCTQRRCRRDRGVRERTWMTVISAAGFVGGSPRCLLSSPWSPRSRHRSRPNRRLT